MRLNTLLALPVLLGVAFVPARAGGVMTVPYDILPGVCPNYFVVSGSSLLDIALDTAVPGSDQVDPQNINVASLVLIVPGGGGLRDFELHPIETEIIDVATPLVAADSCACTTQGPDGILDLLIFFNGTDVADLLSGTPVGTQVPLILTGELYDHTPIAGVDCVFTIAPTAVNPGSWGRTKALYR